MGWERSTLRITGRDTAQTERILMRVVDTSSLDSRLHHPGKRVFARLFSCCLCQCCTHDSSSLLRPHFAHGSGALGYSVLIHGSASCRQLKTLLARSVNLENEAMQARQRQGSAEQALAAASQRIQQLSSGGSGLTPSTGVIDTRTLGKPRTFTGQPAEGTTW